MFQRSSIIVCLLFFGCDDTPAPPGVETVEMPTKQFVFEGLKIEERHGGEILWSGTASRADGDMMETSVEEVRVTYRPRGKNRTYELAAPRGLLTFDKGIATFEDVRIVGSDGSVIEAGNARYEEEREQISATGPVIFEAHGLRINAPSGTVMLATGAIDIDGPVEGRFARPPQVQP